MRSGFDERFALGGGGGSIWWILLKQTIFKLKHFYGIFERKYSKQTLWLSKDELWTYNNFIGYRLTCAPVQEISQHEEKIKQRFNISSFNFHRSVIILRRRYSVYVLLQTWKYLKLSHSLIMALSKCAGASDENSPAVLIFYNIFQYTYYRFPS